MTGPRVVFGLPAYNHVGEVREAIESLLGQTFRDFAVVVVDDGSTDGTSEVLREYAKSAPHVLYVQNSTRLGMIENWRRAFVQALEHFPSAEYFAWASDHDVWHPRWLWVLVRVLDEHPEVVLAYPLNRKIGPDGSLVDRKPWVFDTRAVASPARRLVRTSWHMSAGNMVYGLFRVSALRRAGVFRRVLVPDRLLLAEASLYGQFYQVPEVLWFRRWYGRVFSLARQRAAFFPNGRPSYAWIPWWLSHGAVLGWTLGVRGAGRPDIGRGFGVALALQYLMVAVSLHIVQQGRAARLWLVARVPWLASVSLRRVWEDLRSVLRWLRLGSLKSRVRRVDKQVRRAARKTARQPGVLVLRALKAFPIMRDRVIPWLVRDEIEQQPVGRTVGLTRREVERLARSGRRIVVGPWLSEVGFELLYWIPFLNWATREFGIGRDRLIVVSRGGARVWYQHLAEHYVDLFELWAVGEYRRKNETRWKEGGNQKQYELGDLDREIIGLVRARFPGEVLDWLHPSLMHQLFRFYWYEKGTVSLLRKHTEYRRLPDPGGPIAGLPSDYVAVRFYFRPSFPDTPENRGFVASLVRAVAGHTPVVLLNTGMSLDDHEDYQAVPGRRVHRVDHLMTPQNNLEVQTRVIRHARAFVGTYGGLAYVGPFYGVPAVGFYSHDAKLVPAHLDMSYRLGRLMRAPLTTLRVDQAALLGTVLGSFAEAGTERSGAAVPSGGAGSAGRR